MGRTPRAERGNEKFVQWKEPVESEGDKANFDGPDSTAGAREKKQTRRQTAILSALAATIQRPVVEEQNEGRGPSAQFSGIGVGTSSQSPAVARSSIPAPRFGPPLQKQSRTGTAEIRRPSTTDRTSEPSPESVPDNEQRTADAVESDEHQSDSAASEAERPTGPSHRNAPRGMNVYHQVFVYCMRMLCA